MNRSIYRNKIALLLLLFVVACTGGGGKGKAYLVFVDYSKSASTLDAPNRQKVEGLIHSIAVEMNSEDLLEIFVT